MNERQLIVLQPSEFNEAKLESIQDEVVASIPSYDIVRKDYVLSCFAGLFNYAITEKHETQNFSLSIGFFDPHLNEDLTEKKENEIWSKANVWVKIRVNGGMGSAFRNRYMATQLGIARVDWQRKSFRLLKIAAAQAVKRGTCLGYDHEGWVAWFTQKLFCHMGTRWVKHMKNAQKKRSKDRLDKKRHKERFHKEPLTRDELLSELIEIDILGLTKIISTGEIEQLAKLLYEFLKEKESETLRLDEFLLFWYSILHEPIIEALKFCGKVTEDLRTINIRQFTDLFIISLNRKTVLRDEQIATPRNSSQVSEAKRLVSSFYRLPTMQARGALVSSTDFSELAHKIYIATDDAEVGTVNKRQFAHLSCSALGSSLDHVVGSFSTEAECEESIQLPVFAMCLKNLIESYISADDPFLVCCRFVNEWMCDSEKEVLRLQRQEKELDGMVTKLMELVHATEDRLDYEQYKLLKRSFDLALYIPLQEEQKELEQFQSRLKKPEPETGSKTKSKTKSKTESKAESKTESETESKARPSLAATAPKPPEKTMKELLTEVITDAMNSAIA